jgi:hypothetical protein
MDQGTTMRDGTSTLKFGLALLLFTAAGCDRLPGAELLEPLEPGTPKAEVMALMPHGGIASSDPMEAPQLMQGYWFERYFIQGGIVEVVWIHDVEEGFPTDEFRSYLNPVIFREEVLDGWGWEHFDMRHEDWGILERQPTPGTVAIPDEPGPAEGPEMPEAIPADTAPTGPRGERSGPGTAA